MNVILTLLTTFAKIGILGFGGGSAVAPLIYSECVEKRSFISKDEFTDIVALSNSLPGPSLPQMAGSIGYKKKGIIGAVSSIFAITMPTVFIFTFVMTALIQHIGANIILEITKPVFIVVCAMMISLSKNFFILSNKELSTKITIAISLPIAILSIIFSVHPSIFISLMILFVFIFSKEN